MTDNELVSLSLINQEYFGILMGRYEFKLRRYVRRITNVNNEDQEDILQDIFLKTYLNLNGFNKTLSFSSWIYRITHNEVVDWSRKEKTRKKHGKYDYDDEIFNWTEDTQHFLNKLELQNQKKEIGTILNKLDVKYREVLVLKFIEDQSYREISDILKKPEGTIATLINRAKKSFKLHYETFNEQ
ncbi:MAG: RNA polymerase sigma-70 factor (ECF subfamily) [Crocinitomicaceae bacterium]|jgi:RNA polymerase sigma-70 factor (ECF subfamily)